MSDPQDPAQGRASRLRQRVIELSLRQLVEALADTEDRLREEGNLAMRKELRRRQQDIVNELSRRAGR